MGVIISPMRRRRGTRGGQVTVKGDLVINIGVDVKTGKLSAAGASSWVDGIDQFPHGGGVGFLLDTERRTLRGTAARSRVRTGDGPSGAGRPLQPPAGVTPSHRGLHNQADSAADRTLTPPGSGPLRRPVMLLSAAVTLAEPRMD